MKLITLDNLKTFLDKLLEQISTDVYSKKEVDEKLKIIPKNVYTKDETDNAIKTAISSIKNGNEVNY